MANEPQTDRDKKIAAMVRETAALFKQLIVGRTDAYAFYLLNTQVDPPGTDNGSWIAARRPLKMVDIHQHLLTKRCLGTYMLTPESTVRAIIFDIDLKSHSKAKNNKRIGAPYFEIPDNPDPELDMEQKRGDVEAALHQPDDPAHRWACSLIRSSVAFIQNATFEVLGLTSTPIVTGGGAHVIVPFGMEVPAVEARQMAHSVMESLSVFNRKSENFYENNTVPEQVSLEIEIFPKQDELSDPSSLGNLVRLPFGWHDEAQIRTFALDQSLPQHPNWQLKKTSSLDALRLQANSLDLKWEKGDL